MVAALALAATARDEVPLASGIAVALLVPAALVDRHERRLPDALVAVAAIVFTFVAIVTSVDVAAAVAGAAVFAGPLLFLHLISPGAMGFGDVKAAVVLGVALGAVHWQLALAALALATGITAAAGILTRAREIAFGPSLIAAAAVALAAATTFAPLAPDTTTHAAMEVPDD